MMIISGANRLTADSMQLKRIETYPFQTTGNLIIFDNLEGGTFRVYEQINGPVYIQQLFARFGTVENAALIAEAVINSMQKNEELFIHKISCEYGYESLIQPVIKQILCFADFYGYESVVITDSEYDKCLPHAEEALSDFQKTNRVYEYWTGGHGRQ